MSFSSLNSSYRFGKIQTFTKSLSYLLYTCTYAVKRTCRKKKNNTTQNHSDIFLLNSLALTQMLPEITGLYSSILLDQYSYQILSAHTSSSTPLSSLIGDDLACYVTEWIEAICRDFPLSSHHHNYWHILFLLCLWIKCYSS